MSENLGLYSEAAKSSLENAEQWLKDAKLLMEHGSFGHANALIRFALEEAAKSYVCWFTSEGIWPIENKFVQDVFWDHKVKNEIILGSLLFEVWKRESISKGKVVKAKLRQLEMEKLEEDIRQFELMVRTTEKKRQRAIYVNVNGEVQTPVDIEEIEPKGLLQVADFFLAIVRHYIKEFPESKKRFLREFFSSIPKESWETGDIPIEWVRGNKT